MERVNLKIQASSVLFFSIVMFFVLVFFSHFSIPMIFLGLFLVGVTLIVSSFYFSGRWFEMDSILYRIEREPLSDIATITIDRPIAFSGKIECQSPVESPFSKKPSVFYHFIKEQWISSGKHSRWQVVQNVSNCAPFSVADGHEKIRVSLRNIDSDLSKDFFGTRLGKGLNFSAVTINTGNIVDNKFPDYENSEVDAKHTLRDQIFFEETKGFLGFSSKEKFKANEFLLAPDENVFVYGWVFNENNEKIVAENKDCPLIVSRKTKDDYLRSFAAGDDFFYSNNFFIFAGVILASLVLFVFFNFFALVFLVPAVVLILARVAVQVYNRMRSLQQRIENSESQIDIELNKRADLIPALEEITKKFAKFEKKLMVRIAEIRGMLEKKQLTMSSYSAEQKKLDLALVALVEKYPALSSEALFLDFIKELSQIEENIAYYRGFYSKTVMKYNTLIALFPFSIVANFYHFKPAHYWQEGMD